MLGLTPGGVSSGALSQVLVPSELMGRVAGMIGSPAVPAIPPSALADRVGADRALAREVRAIATWCRRAADAAARW